MKAIGVRIVAIMLGFFLLWYVAGILRVPALQIAGLFSWGLACMLFSYELGGAQRKYRQGFEERSWLERAWLFSGLGCIFASIVLVVMYL